jgi:hypothetical protein
MGEVELPLVEAQTKIEEAIEVMLQTGRSGLVTLHGDKHVVLTFEELVKELRERGDKPLSALVPTTRTITVANMATPKRLADMARRPIEQPDVEELIEGAQADFAVAVPRRPLLMMVVTSRERGSEMTGKTPVLCKCDGGHPYTRAEADERNGECALHLPAKRIKCK